MIAVLVVLIQLAIYEGIDKDVVVYNSTCQVNIGGTDDDFVTKMSCGDDTVTMAGLSAPYLHAVLTEERTPVIMCTKTISKYLKNTRWSCKMDPEETAL
jgi:hypothetical protein